MTIYGTPGGSLDASASWASSKGAADYGRRGEELLGRKLNLIAAETGASVFHDLDDPAGSQANLDHIVLAGQKLLVVDAKVWKPAFYYTLGSRSYRGLLRRAPAVDPHRFAGLVKSSHLLAKKTKTDLAGIVITAIPSSLLWRSPQDRAVHTWALNIPDVTVTGIQPTLRKARRLKGEADRSAAAFIRSLVREDS